MLRSLLFLHMTCAAFCNFFIFLSMQQMLLLLSHYLLHTLLFMHVSPKHVNSLSLVLSSYSSPHLFATCVIGDPHLNTRCLKSCYRQKYMYVQISAMQSFLACLPRLRSRSCNVFVESESVPYWTLSSKVVISFIKALSFTKNIKRKLL